MTPALAVVFVLAQATGPVKVVEFAAGRLTIPEGALRGPKATLWTGRRGACAS